MSAPLDRHAARESAGELDDDEAHAEREAEIGAARAKASVEELAALGDVEGLLMLAKAYRAGDTNVPRDLAKCLACYAAAGDLGSAAGDHAAALFLLAGGVVARDEREGARRVRRAAERGHIASKVALANLYELGVHYGADAAKADVWYRNAARSAGITAEPEAPEHTRAMAELGGVRYCLALANDAATSAEERAHFLRKAKAYGWRERTAESEASATRDEQARASASVSTPPPDGDASGRTTAPPALDAAEEAAIREALERKPKPDDKPTATKTRRDEAKKRTMVDWSDGFIAFFIAVVAVAIGFGVGHLLTEAAQVLVSRDQPVPIVRHRIHLIVPILLAAAGVVPTLLVYRLPTVVRALGIAGLATVAGEVCWGASVRLVDAHVSQLVAFATAGFLAALLVLGLLGGTRRGHRVRRLERFGTRR